MTPQLNAMFKQKSNGAFNNALLSARTIWAMEKKIHEQMQRLYVAAKELHGVTGQSAVASLLNQTPQVVKNWEQRGVSKRGMLLAEEIIGCPAKWIETGEGRYRATSNVIALHPEDPLPDGTILVPESRIKISAGNGHQVNYEIVDESEPATYRMSWFQKRHINPTKVRRFRVTGDSGEPLLYAGDSVLVNLAENDLSKIIDGKLYALRYGDELRLKRLYRRLDGTLTLRSENPAYKDEDVSPELVEEHITLIGRVRDRSGAGGL